ncbi:ArnT family glycosyltransferase [Patescibacteria group bacterium]
MKKVNPLILIFSLSLFFRLAVFNHAKTFGTDQARDVLLIKEHVENKTPIVLGPKASVGDFYLPPFYYYLISVPWVMSSGHPYSATLLNIILESFTPVVLYIFIKKFWNEKAAVFSSTLYLLSPMTMQYASFAWNPNVIPFFSICFLYFLFDYVINKNNKSLPKSLVLAILAMQLHYQAFILFFTIIPIFFYEVFLKKRSIKPWVKSIIYSATTFTLLLFDPKTSQENINNIILYFKNNHSKIYQTTYTFDFFWQFMSRMYSLLLGFRHKNYLYGRAVLFIGSSVIGIKSLHEYVSKKKVTSNLLFTIFILSSFLGLRVYKGDKWEYFLSFMYFVPAITLSLSTQYIFKKKSLNLVLIAVFFSGMSFPLLSRARSDDVKMINFAKEESIKRYPNQYNMKNYNKYFENSFKYLRYQGINENNDPNTIIFICPSKYKCNIPYCSHREKPEKEIYQLPLDGYSFNDSWRVEEISVTSFKKS